MNDYKELIEELAIKSACVKYNDDCFLCAELGEKYEACRHDRELFFQAKAAIEQLVRERDALKTALEDVIQNATSPCWFCADTNCKFFTEYGEKCEEWQWRGVE